MTDHPAVAFVDAPRDWVRHWARYFMDHGPARVVDLIGDPRAAWDHPWQVLLVDATSQLLTRQFVDDAHARRRGVVAVIDPADPSTKQLAREAGVDLVVEHNATPLEAAVVIDTVAGEYPVPLAEPQPHQRRRPPLRPRATRPPGQIVAVGGAPGAEPEPVALGLATLLARRRERVVVVDANEVCPALAQLTGRATTPNLASAAAAVTQPGYVALAHLQEVPAGGVWLLAGLSSPQQWTDLTSRATRDVALDLAAQFDRVIVQVSPVVEDLTQRGGDRFGISRALLEEADAVVAVAEASPVGVTRVATWMADARLAAHGRPFYLAVTGAPAAARRFPRRELEERLLQLYPKDAPPPARPVMLPEDRDRYRRAGWDGVLVRRGPALRTLEDLAVTACPPRPRGGR